MEIARELLNKFDRFRELKIRGAGRDEVCPAIRGERLLLEVADALAEYNITSADPFEEVSRRLTEYEKINSELVSHEKELATLNAMRGLDVDGEDSDDTEESLARERSEVTAEISAIDRELAIRESGYNSDMMDLSSRELLLIEKERLSEKLAGLEGELRVVQSTRDYLSRAADAMNARYLEGALESFKRYSEMLLAAGADAQMSTDFSTSVVDGGGTRSTESYSRGTRDAYRLAARLAILDSLYSGEEPFLLLDDPFASFDDRRCDEGMALLERIGEEKQAIYFTCAESRGGRSAIRLGDMKK